MADHLPPPLSGVRVLELAHLIAGPICGMYLADMGADVVKVESREAPDAGRSVYPRAMRNGEGVLHLTVNRNKRGICLDVKQPEGRDAFLRLAGWADVIIEGFRGGVAERLGIDYESVKGSEPAPHLLLDLRLRARRPLAREAGPRLARAGPGRPHGRSPASRRAARCSAGRRWPTPSAACSRSRASSPR